MWLLGGPRGGLGKKFLGSLLLAIFSGPLINYSIIRPLLTTIWRDQKRLHCSCIRNAWIFSCFIILLSINHFTISRLNWHKRLELPRERTVIVEVLLRFCYYKLTNLKIWPIQICLSRIDLFFNCYLPILYECGTRFHDCSINVTVSMSIEQTITRRKQFC